MRIMKQDCGVKYNYFHSYCYISGPDVIEILYYMFENTEEKLLKK